jgi:hypothetical protein
MFMSMMSAMQLSVEDYLPTTGRRWKNKENSDN